MDYLNQVLLKIQPARLNQQRTKKEISTPLITPETGLEIKENVLISAQCVPGHSAESRIIFHPTMYR